MYFYVFIRVFLGNLSGSEPIRASIMKSSTLSLCCDDFDCGFESISWQYLEILNAHDNVTTTIKRVFKGQRFCHHVKVGNKLASEQKGNWVDVHSGLDDKVTFLCHWVLSPVAGSRTRVTDAHPRDSGVFQFEMGQIVL